MEDRENRIYRIRYAREVGLDLGYDYCEEHDEIYPSRHGLCQCPECYREDMESPEWFFDEETN